MYKLKGNTIVHGDFSCKVLYTFHKDDPDYLSKYTQAVSENNCIELEKTVYEGDLMLDGDLYVTCDYKFTVRGCQRTPIVQPSNITSVFRNGSRATPV